MLHFGLGSKAITEIYVNHTRLISKMDPIKYIFEKPTLTGRISRWQMLLSEFYIEYHTQKAIKGSVLAEYLALQSIDDYQFVKYDFIDEDLMYLNVKDCDEPLPKEGPDSKSRWSMMFDGAVMLMEKELVSSLSLHMGHISLLRQG